MSLRFIDSFDHYSIADLLGTGNGQKYSTVVQSNMSLSLYSGGRFNNCARLTFSNLSNPNCSLIKTLDAQATWIIGVAFRVSSYPSVNVPIISLFDSGTTQCDLRFNTTGTLSITRNGTVLTSGTSTNTISINTWYYVELMVTISSSISANTCQVNVNGVNWVNVATGQSTKNTANSTANQIYIGTGGIASGWQIVAIVDYDDLYICDGTGSINNTFLGDVRVECRFPSAPSATNTNWLASSGTTTGCISDLTPNGDNSYIYSATTNDISTFTVPALVSTPSTIFGIQLTHSSRKTDAGTRQISDAVRSGTTNYLGTTVNLSTSYIYYSSIYQTDPNTSAAWTASAVNAVEIGVKEIT